MKNNEDNIKTLDEVLKGLYMGYDAICFIKEKLEDKKLKSVLNKTQKEYNKMIDDINKIYQKYNSKNSFDVNIMNKVMSYYGIEIKTLFDSSTSHLAEILIKGTNMGIIEGRKLLNNKTIDKNISKIVQEFISINENSLEELKKFL